MEKFSYEQQDRKEKYETYEWDNTWLEHADKFCENRIFYIGDSISCGIRTVATSKTNNKLLFDGLGTSKGIDNPFFKKSTSKTQKSCFAFAKQL